ncbi:MAG: cupin domain-containing protein [Chloroflexi bacterium]|nr:cupin domain-containing protein [Chloroflexota bacterium]
MATDAQAKAQADEVQIFDVAEGLSQRDHLHGRVDMATGGNSYIAVFQTPPRGGETHVHQHPDSDQILFVLSGECTVEGLTGTFVLKPNQGVLIPAGVHYGFTNTAQEDLIFLSMRSESTGGRRVGYVPNVPSGTHIRVPYEAVGAQGIGRHLYVYALDRRTIGISPLLLEEWNRGSLLRMNCEYVQSGAELLANLPERLVRWYDLPRELLATDYRIVVDDGTRARVDLTPLIQREVTGD